MSGFCAATFLLRVGIPPTAEAVGFLPNIFMSALILPTFYLFVNTDEGPVHHTMVLARYAFEPERVHTGLDDVYLVVDAGQWILTSMDRAETWTMAHEPFVDRYMPGEEAGWAYMADVLQKTLVQWNTADSEDLQDAACSKEDLAIARQEDSAAPWESPREEEVQAASEKTPAAQTAAEEIPVAQTVAAAGGGYALCVESVQNFTAKAVFSLQPDDRLLWRTRLRHAWHILRNGRMPALRLQADLDLLFTAVDQAPRNSARG